VASDRPVDLDVGDLQMVAEFDATQWSVWPCRRRGECSCPSRATASTPSRNSVEEVIENKAVAYPNEEINTLNTAAPSTHFLSAQSVYVDSSDTLWVLDVGNLGSGTPLISGGAKLVAIDLTTNAVKRTIVFPDSLITKGTSINDVRFDLARGAAGFAYIPDSSAAAGSGIIVVDLSTGNAVRRLANDPTVLPDPAFRATVEGKPFVIQATVDAAPSLVSVAAATASRFRRTGQAGVLLPDCQPELVFRGCRRADGFHPIRRRRGRDGQEPGRQGRSGWLGSGRAGARLSDERGVSTPSCGSIRRRERRTTFNPTFETVVHNRHLVWPDSLALGKDGTLYITLDAGESFASFQRGAGSAAAAVLSVQGTDGRDAGDAVRAEGLNRNFTESVTGNSRLSLSCSPTLTVMRGAFVVQLGQETRPTEGQFEGWLRKLIPARSCDSAR